MKNELIFGNEPYLIWKYQKEAVKAITMPDLNIMESDQFTERERDFVKQMPFMAARKVLILKFDKLQTNSMLENYLENPAQKTDLYIFVKEVDKRLSIYKKFQKEQIRQFDKNPETLNRFILGHIKKNGCRITRQAYDELVYRINYDMEDIDLYYVKSVLDKLCATSDEVTPHLVEWLVPPNEKEDVFRLIRLIDERKTVELFH